LANFFSPGNIRRSFFLPLDLFFVLQYVPSYGSLPSPDVTPFALLRDVKDVVAFPKDFPVPARVFSFLSGSSVFVSEFLEPVVYSPPLETHLYVPPRLSLLPLSPLPSSAAYIENCIPLFLNLLSALVFFFFRVLACSSQPLIPQTCPWLFFFFYILIFSPLPVDPPLFFFFAKSPPPPK